MARSEHSSALSSCVVRPAEYLSGSSTPAGSGSGPGGSCGGSIKGSPDGPGGMTGPGGGAWRGGPPSPKNTLPRLTAGEAADRGLACSRILCW